MKASDVVEALERHWPDDAYLKIREAPQHKSRDGRKIDLLVLGVWQSRGLEREAVEIKVSRSDLTRELKEPSKADWWWHHCHRFWLAVPAGLKVSADEIPATWGLLKVSDAGRVAKARQAPRNDSAETLPWGSVLGVIRSAHDAGLNALNRAEQRGFDRGVQRAQLDYDRADPETRARDELSDLKAKVDAFHAASGVDIGRAWNPDEAAFRGEAVRLATQVLQLRKNADRQIESARQTASQLDEALSTLRAVNS